MREALIVLSTKSIVPLMVDQQPGAAHMGQISSPDATISQPNGGETPTPQTAGVNGNMLWSKQKSEH